MHPANVIKTLLQTKGSTELQNLNFRILTRGAGAQFVLSLPHGALAFAVLEVSTYGGGEGILHVAGGRLVEEKEE